MLTTHWWGTGILAVLVLAWLTPELALAGNKFETIGGGVVGSSAAKLEYVRWFGIGFGSFFLVCAIISLTAAHSNGLMLNYAVWKQSGIILIILSVLCFGIAVLAS